MLLADLRHHIGFGAFIDTVRTKLNGSYIKYKGSWHYCQISGDDVGGSSQYGSPDATGWVYLYGTSSEGKNTDYKLTSIDDLDTEPEWPKAGYYYLPKTPRCIDFCYSQKKSYKAGLSEKSILLKRLNGQPLPESNYRQTCKVLNSIEIAKYPTLMQAKYTLLNSSLSKVPLTLTLYLGAHPYSQNPIIYYRNKGIAEYLDNGKIRMSHAHDQLKEYLKHIGDINA